MTERDFLIQNVPRIIAEVQNMTPEQYEDFKRYCMEDAGNPKVLEFMQKVITVIDTYLQNGE